MNTITRILSAAVTVFAFGCRGDGGIESSGDSIRGMYADVAAADITVEGICDAVTPEQKEWFGIERIEWKSSDGAIPFPHCKILSSVAKSGAVFSPGYQLTEFNENIPTAAISRIACKPTGRVVHGVLIPGNHQDWTGSIGVNGFRNFGGPASGCIAITAAEHPSGLVLESIDSFDALYLPSNNGWDYVTGLHAITQNTSQLIETLFLDVMSVPEDRRLTACVGISLGVVLGFGLMDDWKGLSCDGMLLVGGGDGYFPRSELFRSVCAGGRILPLTGLTASCVVEDLANTIGLYDKALRDEVLHVLATQGEEPARALLDAYDITAASPAVQNIAERLTPTGALVRPTMVVHGTNDYAVVLGLRYMNRVLANQREHLVRFYLANGLDHDQSVNFTTVAAARLLLRWMQGEGEPRDLTYTLPGIGTLTAKNSKDAGFEGDPCGYYDFVSGSSACRDSGLFSTGGIP